MCSLSKIPKVIFQTSKVKQPEYVIKLIKSYSEGWEYIHFTDDDILKFFEENVLEEFPNMKEKFLSILTGAHKADLFRYYYLYVKGGVFIDSDAMIYKDMNDVVKDYDFFSVESTYFPGSIFNGFIGTTEKNKIIYEALKHAYNIDVDELRKSYMTFCKQLHEIYHEHKVGQSSLLYLEKINDNDSAKMVNIDNEIVLIHYYKNKVVPNICEYKLKITENSKPKIGITLSFPKDESGLFVNGIKQNALFFYKLLINIDKYDIYFIVDKKSIECETYLHEMKYKYIHYDYVQTENFNIIFSFGFWLSTTSYLVLKQIGTKNIFYNCGNLYISDSENCLFSKKDEDFPIYNRFRYFDECWNIPQMENTNHFYLKTLLRCDKIIEVPFIWSPELIDNEKNKYVKRSEPKSIAIFEPNISIMKWSFPAILICENAYRDNVITNKIKNVYVTNIVKNTECDTKFNINTFNNIVKCLDLKKDGKITAESRHNSLFIMANYADIAVSHTWENYLNYLYFDIAWMGWPVVHNGKLCRDIGYYYDEFNYEMGGNVLKDVILNHDEVVDEYLLRNRLHMQKYLPTNKELKKHYENLITECLTCN